MSVPNKPFEVELDLRCVQEHGDDWSTVLASNGRPYSYKYICGEAKNGHITHTVNAGPAKITMKLMRADHRYELDRVFFTFDDDKQLSCEKTGKRKATIRNECTKAMDARYGVRVRDKEAGVTFLCDPAIKNKNPE